MAADFVPQGRGDDQRGQPISAWASSFVAAHSLQSASNPRVCTLPSSIQRTNSLLPI
jgi:hypothetical protein